MASLTNSSSGCPVTGSAKRPVILKNPTTGKEFRDTLHHSATHNLQCTDNVCMGSFMAGQSLQRPNDTPRSKEEVWKDAQKYLKEYYESNDDMDPADLPARLEAVHKEIEEKSVYELTYEELCYGAKVAWRQAPRCVARILWNTLYVFDCRHIKTTREMFHALLEHMDYATNEGNLRSTITIFPVRVPGRQDFRLWNALMLAYAGYRQPDGSIIGDPAHANFTEICQSLGWKGKGTRFDVLPLVFSAPGEEPTFYEIPEKHVLQVHFSHPEYDWFKDLGYRWFSIPAVSDMRLDCGGLEFTAAPFNGWYTGPEIGTRDLCDPHRYNVLAEVAEKMGLDMSPKNPLWRDRALIQVNLAVLHSFQKQGVTIVDHHSVSDSFMKFMEQEQKLRGGCNADWVWIVPPFGSNLVPTYRQDMLNYNLKPSYEYQEKVWKHLIKEPQPVDDDEMH